VTAADLTVESTAREMVRAVRDRQISARELLDLHLARIEQRNGEINAIVSLDVERARAAAAAADEALANGHPVGPLHGLPFAVKDTHLLAGWRTTFGSPLHADFVPDADTLAVERIRGAGVVLLGRTNVPEFAAGSHTFNTIFGTTRNPADPSRSAGGSSGGAAAALASGMVPLADGSDMGGSLRNPASFCGVVGLRPSLGRVPDWPALNHWETIGVTGPMARTVDDAALLLSVMAGPDPRAPQALGDPGATFASPEPASLTGLRVASSVDLGGAFEVDDQVAALHEVAGGLFTDQGARVSPAYPDLAEAEDTFRTLRAWNFWAVHGPTLAANPAYAQRTLLSQRMREFFTSYDVLVLPVSQVPPFPADQEYPTEINGQPMGSYLDWMRSAYFISATGCPAISVPAGRTSEGLPVGVQIVGPHGSDLRLLEIAAGFESAVAS
jgi:amidase